MWVSRMMGCGQQQDGVWLAAGWGVVSSRVGCGQQQDGVWSAAGWDVGQQQDGVWSAAGWVWSAGWGVVSRMGCGQQDGVWSAAGWGVVSRMGEDGVWSGAQGCSRRIMLCSFPLSLLTCVCFCIQIKKLQSQLKVLRELTAKGPSLVRAHTCR